MARDTLATAILGRKIMSEALAKREDELEMHPIATRILFEDKDVRVWEQLIEPGAELKAHRHDNDYVLVDLAGTTIDVEMLPGNQGEFKGEFAFECARGDVHIIKKGGVERAFNNSDKPYRAILVELLD